jgi:hypothetical protein
MLEAFFFAGSETELIVRFHYAAGELKTLSAMAPHCEAIMAVRQ